PPAPTLQLVPSPTLFRSRSVVESSAGGGDGFVDIGGIGFCDAGDDFSGGWVDGRKSFAGGGVHPFVVDEQLGCGDFYCRFKNCGDRKSTRLNSSHVSISY